MINGIMGTGFWAISSSQFTWTVTFNMAPSNVFADVALSKVSGNGSAMAYIHHYTFFDTGSNTFMTRSWAGAPDQAPTLDNIHSSPSVTFGLTINNMFGFGTAKLYFL